MLSNQNLTMFIFVVVLYNFIEYFVSIALCYTATTLVYLHTYGGTYAKAWRDPKPRDPRDPRREGLLLGTFSPHDIIVPLASISAIVISAKFEPGSYYHCAGMALLLLGGLLPVLRFYWRNRPETADEERVRKEQERELKAHTAQGYETASGEWVCS